MPHRHAIRTIIPGLILTFLTSALAQPTQPPAPAAGAVPLASDPVRIESVGLSFLVPEGSTVQRVGAGTTNHVSVTPKDNTWTFRIQSRQSTNKDLSVRDIAQTALTQLQASVGVMDSKREKIISTLATVLDQDQNLTIADHHAERFYVRLPRADARGHPLVPIVRGLTVFQVEPGQFVTFELITTEPQYDHARIAYETTVATARFTDPAKLNAIRRGGIQLGQAVLNRLTPDDYEAVINNFGERWFRLYEPKPGRAPSDATEMGYRWMRVWKGQRGELDPSKPRSRWMVADKAEGYLVRIDSRMRWKENAFIDTSGTFFMTPDRTEEAWLLRTTVRGKNEQPITYNETGARTKNSMAVHISGTGQADQTVQPIIQGDGYITRVEAFILPQLLVRGGVPSDYAFYTFRSESSRIMLRTDSLDQPPDRPGLWRLTTKLSEDHEPQITLLNAKGDLMQTTLANGQIWEPTDLDRLRRLWMRAGLPTK